MSEDIIRKHLSWLNKQEKRTLKNGVDVFYTIVHLPKEKYQSFYRKLSK